MIRRTLMFSLLALPLAMSACNVNLQTKPPVPTPTPTFVPPSIPPGGQYSDSGIQVSGGSLYTQLTGKSGGIASATIALYGPTLATSSTDSSGQATLSPLEPGGGYRLVVSAPGYATQEVGNITITKQPQPISERLTMSQGAKVSGHVTAGGQPVAGAVVSDGLNSTMTDSQGAYSLDGVALSSVTLTVSKPKYSTGSHALTVAEQGATGIDFTLEPTQAVAYFDPSVSPGIPLAKFQGLQQALQNDGWQIAPQAPSQGGAWVLVSPSMSLPSATASQLASFVAQGGKLIVFGEWGGFAGFKNPDTNALVHPFGVHFDPDLIRDPAATNPDWPAVHSFAPNNPAVAGVNAWQLYQACSVFGVGPAAVLAQTGSGAYQVEDNAQMKPWAVLVGGPYKGGKAIAVGDASAFSDEDTDGNGRSNLQEADNQHLVTQLFDW
ncbi:MAG TPA: DUF4350 domain-containing protein [Oscillatoriaceae cyanobacterium]